MNKEIVLSVDLGGTNLRVSAVDRDGNILFRTRCDTPRAGDVQRILYSIVEESEKCLAVAEPQGKVFAIGTVVPGTVDVEKGIVKKAPNLTALNDFAITEAIEDKLNLTCVLENDANAAAIGEGWRGASKGVRNSICVTLGTGVGGGIIIDGKILRGVNGTAGEIGHICVEPFGAPCGCGSRGCVEQYASATAVKRLAAELGVKYPNSIIHKNIDSTSLEIYQAGKYNDDLALEVFRVQGFYLGITLAGLINAINPEVIIIGGGAAAGWDLFSPYMIEQINERAYREPAERARISRAQLGDDAGILGAARLAFESISSLN